MERIEKRHILEALRKTGWNKTQAAELLGIHHNRLNDKIRKYQINFPGEGKMIFVVHNLHIYNLDEVAADTLAACNGRDRSEIIADVQRCHPPDEVEETLEQLEQLGR